MKRFLIVFVTVFALSSSAFAQERQPTQVMTTVSGNVSVSEAVSVGTSASYFWIPADESRMIFAYAGPSFQISDNFWVSPQVGYAGGWIEGEDSFIPALNMGADVGSFTLFVGLNDIISSEGSDYFGAYGANYIIDLNGSASLNMGVVSEQINDDITLGPRIGLTRDSWHGEVQAHIDPTTGDTPFESSTA